jgi:hypothetical protein
MMKVYLLLLTLFFSLHVFAFENNYNVRGVISSGGAVQGNAYDDPDEDIVYGQIVDENGLSRSYEGKWIDNGVISGETDDGETVQLSTR